MCFSLFTYLRLRAAGVTPVYRLETRLPAPFRYRYVSCLSSVRRLLCSKGYLGRPVAIVWDMWRVLPALSHLMSHVINT